jgi:hypothetical protein
MREFFPTIFTLILSKSALVTAMLLHLVWVDHFATVRARYRLIAALLLMFLYWRKIVKVTAVINEKRRCTCTLK